MAAILQTFPNDFLTKMNQFQLLFHKVCSQASYQNYSDQATSYYLNQ